MKSTFTRVMVSSLLIAFAVGCGKDKSSGSSAPVTIADPLKPGVVVTDTKKAFANLKTWYSKADTVNIGSLGIFTKKSLSTNSGFDLEFSYCLFGKGNGCSNNVPNKCYLKGPNGLYGVTSPTVQNGIIVGCYPEAASFNYTKSGNPSLKQAMNIGDTGLELKSASQSGTRFTLTYGPSGSMYATKKFIIDTSYHSLVNPIVEQDESQITQLEFFKVAQ